MWSILVWISASSGALGPPLAEDLSTDPRIAPATAPTRAPKMALPLPPNEPIKPPINNPANHMPPPGVLVMNFGQVSVPAAAQSEHQPTHYFRRNFFRRNGI